MQDTEIERLQIFPGIILKKRLGLHDPMLICNDEYYKFMGP